MPTFDASIDSAPLTRFVLTRSESDLLGADDRYDFERDGGSLSVSASADNTGRNRRELYWPSDAAVATNEMSCQTWDANAVGGEQQGIALRIAPTADGLGERAITVTKNVYSVAVWDFNVHLWDTTISPFEPWQQLAQFSLASTLGSSIAALTPLPWHVCARVIGSTFEFMVWTGTNPQPDWSDSTKVEQVVLPDGWDYPGVAGWFVGHLAASGKTTVSGMRTWTLAATTVPATTL